MREATPTLDTVVCEAVEIADPAERAAFLASACGGDYSLRERAEALVAAHFRAGDGFLEPALPAADSTVAFVPGADDSRTPQVGATVGPYKLLEQIGEGGMGLVFVAEQERPVRRKVALKIIKPGMDSRQVIARFEQERQALALMDHPHIARVLDAGTTAGGLPFFAMELVRGLPVVQFSDRSRLPLADRLRLFAQVCRAVQHAHQKGVIHRDLKPSNILVAEVDGKPVPKVIDFGIAKATSGPLTDATLHTGFHQFVGTPQYMSPEQAAVSGVDVDTRSDVYSLGVLLYELLTGRTPVDPTALRTRGLDEVRRMVREDEPPSPSKQLSTLDAKHAGTVADARRADPRWLARQVRGELDWVVMKALDKDRGRRYQSPADLAADVERYLADEPVQAAPPSAAYRLRKFTRRNRAALVTLSLVATALLAGTAVSVWQAVEANRARRAADDRLQNELRAKAEAAESHLRARAAVKQMLTRVAVKEVGRFPEMKAVRRKLLEDAVTFYTEMLKLDPAAADVYFERGKVYWHLLRYDDAVRDYEAVLALDPEHVPAHVQLGSVWSYGKQDRQKGIVYLTRAAELDGTWHGERDPDCLSHRIHYALCWHLAYTGNKAEARKWLQSYLELAPPSAATDRDSATLYNTLRDYRTSLPLIRRAIEQMPDDGWSYYILAGCLSGLGDKDGEFAAISEAIRLNPEPYEFSAGELYQWRARLLFARRDYASALADFNRTAEYHALDPIQIRCRAYCHFHLGNYPAALADITRAVELKPDDPGNITWIPPERVAACPDAAFRQGVLDRATRAIELSKGSPRAYAARAALYAAMKMDAKARDDWETATDGYKRRVAEREGQPDHAEARRDLANIQAMRGHSLLEAGAFADAEPILRECLAARDEVDPDSWLRFNTMSLLGGALLGQTKYAEAEPLLLKGYEGMQKREPTIPESGKIRLTESLGRIVQLYEVTDQPEKAREWRAKKPPAAPR